MYMARIKIDRRLFQASVYLESKIQYPVGYRIPVLKKGQISCHKIPVSGDPYY
jgi:hypothetical protein